LHTFHYNPVAPPGGQHYPKDYNNKESRIEKLRGAGETTDKKKATHSSATICFEIINLQPKAKRRCVRYKKKTTTANYNDMKSQMFMIDKYAFLLCNPPKCQVWELKEWMWESGKYFGAASPHGGKILDLLGVILMSYLSTVS